MTQYERKIIDLLERVDIPLCQSEIAQRLKAADYNVSNAVRLLLEDNIIETVNGKYRLNKLRHIVASTPWRDIASRLSRTDPAGGAVVGRA